jgi:2-haloacid dehalogenase
MSTSALSAVQALVFDTYGTVVDWRTSVLEALRALGRSLHLAIDWEAFLALWEPRPILDRVNAGELPWMTMEQVHRLAPRRHWRATVSPSFRTTRSIVSC